jgi:predicted nucleotidyltransferase
VHHYLGFAANQWKLFEKESPRRVKPLLYVFRVFLTGIHLMQSGEIEANLHHLNAEYGLPFIPELIARKTSGVEHQTLDAVEFSFYEAQFAVLNRRLIEAGETTKLPAKSNAKEALNDLLVQLRLQTIRARRI